MGYFSFVCEEYREHMTLESVLITGGTGSFGKTMLNGLLENGVPEIRVLSRDEEKQDSHI